MSTAFSMVTASQAAPNARMSDAFKNEAGAFDLPSILVGVVVVGILTAGVLASIFGVIPFAQDKGAEQDLGSIVTAQGVYLAASSEQYGQPTNTYAVSLTALAADGVDLISDSVATGTDIAMVGTVGDFTAVTQSGSGEFFKVTSENTKPEKMGKDFEDVDAALASLTGDEDETE